MSAAVNCVAIDRLFDASVANQLGISKAEMRWLYYGFAVIGVFFATVGAFVPLPKIKPSAKSGRRPKSP
ncbi:MAG: hypothetical protein J6386_06590 [Candidatus Synoicihabitans palmerolidicus]|nr:hypothetical protein [Candidatus Synoicihabitans palmerolidicus]